MGAYSIGTIPFGALPTASAPQVAQQYASLGAMMQERQLRAQQIQSAQQEMGLREQQIEAARMQNQATQMDLNMRRSMMQDLVDAHAEYNAQQQSGGSAPAASTAPGGSSNPSATAVAPGAAPAPDSTSSMMAPWLGDVMPIMPTAPAASSGAGVPLSGMAGSGPVTPGPVNTPTRLAAPAGTGAPGSSPSFWQIYLNKLQSKYPPSVWGPQLEAYNKMAQEAATLDKTRAETRKADNEAIAQSAQGLLNLSPDERQRQLPAELEQWVNNGKMSAEDKARILQDEDYGDDRLQADLRTLVARGTLQNQIFEQGQKDRDYFSKQIQNDIAASDSNTYGSLRSKYQNLHAPQNLIDEYLPENGQWSPDLAYNTALSQLPVNDRPKFEQEQRALWSNRLASARTPDQYSTTLGQMPTGMMREVGQLVGKFDPATSPAVLQNWGLTPEQRTQADLRRTIELARIQNLNARTAETSARTSQIGNKPQYTPEFLAREHEKLDQWQNQEQQQWALHGKLGELIDPTKTPEGTQFPDPTSKSGLIRTMDDDQRKRLTGEYTKAETAAKGLAKQQDDMAKQYSWGRYAGQPLPASKSKQANTPPPPPPDSKAARVPEGMTVTGPDGTVWKKVNGQMIAQ
jgi:hypothetical protein